MSKKHPGDQRPETASNHAPPIEIRRSPAATKLPRLPRPFVLLNIPKTGTSYTTFYVEHADLFSAASIPGMTPIFRRKSLPSRIARRLGRTVQTGLKPHLPYGYMNFYKKHTPYCRLPDRLRSLSAVSILREPVSWLISDYIYRTRPYGDHRHRLKKLRSSKYKSFVQKYMGGEISAASWCNLSLEGFWHFRWDVMRLWRIFNDSTLAADFPIGALGCLALIFLHREPGRVFVMHAEEVEDYFASGRWRQDLCQAYFLRHEQLQEDLYSVMLKQLGYRREILDTALEVTPVRIYASPARRKKRALRELEQKPCLREKILQGERIYRQYILPLAGASQ